MSQGGSPSQVGAINVAVQATVDQASFDAAKAKVAAETQKMAQFAVVPVGANAAKAAGLRGGGDSPIPPVPEKTQQSFREAQKNVTFLTRAFGQLTAGAGAIVSVFNAIGAAVDYTAKVFGSGKKAAEEFYATIGGGGAVGKAQASQELEKIRQQLQAVDSELARINEKAGASGFAPTLGRSRKTVLEDRERLLQLQNALSGQVKGAMADERRRAQQKQMDDDAEIARAEEKVYWEQFYQGLQDKIDRRRENREADSALQREREQEINETAALQQSLDEERVERLKSMRDALDPFGGGIDRHNELLRELDMMKRFASSESQKQMIEFLKGRAVDAFVEGLKQKEREIGDIFTNAIEASVSSQFGAQNVTTLLRDISTKVAAIQVAIPRSP